jgi:hypothetical protein
MTYDAQRSSALKSTHWNASSRPRSGSEEGTARVDRIWSVRAGWSPTVSNAQSRRSALAIRRWHVISAHASEPGISAAIRPTPIAHSFGASETLSPPLFADVIPAVTW